MSIEIKKITGIAIIVSDKKTFKTKAITRDKERSSNSTSGYLSKETQNANSKRHILPYVHCSIILITEIWKQPKCSSIDK